MCPHVSAYVKNIFNSLKDSFLLSTRESGSVSASKLCFIPTSCCPHSRDVDFSLKTGQIGDMDVVLLTDLNKGLSIYKDAVVLLCLEQPA